MHFTSYDDFISALEKEIKRLEKIHADAISCTLYCSDCCIEFSVLPVEANALVMALDRHGQNPQFLADVRANLDGKRCPFLSDDRCLVYQSRPMMCRTQGLPLGYVSYERQEVEVSACDKNFSRDHGFELNELLLMDEFIAALQQINLEFSRIKGILPDERVSLNKLAREFLK